MVFKPHSGDESPTPKLPSIIDRCKIDTLLRLAVLKSGSPYGGRGSVRASTSSPLVSLRCLLLTMDKVNCFLFVKIFAIFFQGNEGSCTVYFYTHFLIDVNAKVLS